MKHKDDAKPYWMGEEWSIEGEIREPTAQENLVLYFMLFDTEN